VKLRRSLLVLAALCGGPLACAFGLDGYTGGSGGSGAAVNEAGADIAVPTDAPVELPDATIDSPFTSCPSGRGPKMVLVDDGKGTRFCIDSTEVTNAQYAAFLNTSPKTSGQPTACATNASFSPSDTGSFENIAMTQYPVANVDWCDARAYCAWAGKRLCGHIGGGAVATSDARTDPFASEFMYVCTKASTQLYSYGTSYIPAICNANGGGGQPMPAGVRGGCEGGFPGVFDLVGNVGEWTDDCEAETGPGDSCPVNSSSFSYVNGDPRTAQRCDHFDPQQRADTFSDLGFRCCFH